jgi:D-alanine-D-alanine ligase
VIHKLRVGVIRGGPSHEYDISLQTGANVLSALGEHHVGKYEAHDIHIDQEGKWHYDGVPVNIGDLSNRLDVAVNALHGNYGEDGKIQHVFELHGIPFTGSGSLGSAIGMNKVLTKKVFASHGIQTPLSRTVSSQRIKEEFGDIHNEFYDTLILPVVVKPIKSGSSVGVTIVRKYDELPHALLKAIHFDDTVMIEDYVKGIEATCGVIDDFRGEELYALPPVEIRPDTEFFDYAAKYAGKSSEIVPATFSHIIKHNIQNLAKKIHRALGLRHYSRSDFIIHPSRGIYALEVNTLPGLTGESLFPKSLRAVGSDTPEFIDHLIQLAIRR